MKNSSKIIGGAIAASIAMSMAFIKPFEGNVGNYLDLGGKPTNCWGNTKNVDLSRNPSMQECNALMTADIRERTIYIWSVLKPQPSFETTRAFVSLSYNCGQSVFKPSNTIPKLWNSGKQKEACQHIKDICITSNGKFVMGLQKRRITESQVCLAGLS